MKKGYPLPIVGKGHYTLAPVFVDDIVNGIISTINNDQASRKVFIFEGPDEYTFVGMVEALDKHLKKKTLKIYLPVFLVKILAFCLYVLKSDILYRDQIPRLLCPKEKSSNCSFDDLGIKPKQFEERIKHIFHAGNRIKSPGNI